jgi:hypothetical protein
MIEVCKKLLANNEEISKAISYTGLSDGEIKNWKVEVNHDLNMVFGKQKEPLTLNIIIILKIKFE